MSDEYSLYANLSTPFFEMPFITKLPILFDKNYVKYHSIAFNLLSLRTICRMHINKRNSAFWETARSVGIISKNYERRSKIENEASPENQLVDWWKVEHIENRSR